MKPEMFFLKTIQQMFGIPNILKVLVIGILMTGCHPHKQVITLKEFTQEYKDSLSVRYPTIQFSLIDDTTISSKGIKNDWRIYSHNAYLAYLSDTALLSEILSSYTSGMGESFDNERTSRHIDKDKILPIIKPVRYLDDVRKEEEKFESKSHNDTLDPVCEVYNQQLLIFYVEDQKNSMRFIRYKDLNDISLCKDSLSLIAIQNLNKSLTNIQGKGGNGLFMVTAGGNYEASLILLKDIFVKTNFPVKGDFIIAIPNRDLFFITGSKEDDGIKKLRDLISSSYYSGDHPISEDLFRWNGNRFEKYITP